MSGIDDLIRKLCPNGVPYRPLGEVASFRRGEPITKKDTTAGPIPVVAGGRGPAYFHNEANRSGVTIAVAGSGAYAGYVSYWDKPVFVSDAFSVHPTEDLLEPRFVYHFLASMQNSIHRMKTGGGVPHVKAKDLVSIRISVPPLEVQREIVRALDLFTTLESELESELEARRLQYAHYRDSLLTFPAGGVRWAAMGEVATVVRGASPRPIQAFLTEAEDGVPWIKIGDVPAASKYITRTVERVTPAGAEKSRLVRPGDFVLSNSMSFGRPYITAIEGCIHDGWLAINDFGASFAPDFLYHLLRSAPIQNEFARRAGAGTVRNLNADIVKAVVLPVPPLELQERIVGILDKFDALVNDLSIGLPAELAARRKQYEYYRDRLLTFKEAAA